MIDPTQAGAACDDDNPAAAFLTALDPYATAWTFQTFDDNKERAAAYRKTHEGRADPELTRVINGPLSQHRGTLHHLNDRGCGIFVTVNRTDLTGRKTTNIEKVRALFLDLDGAPLGPVLGHATPHIVIESSPTRFHAYWLVHDVKLDQFAAAQKILIARFGSDPSVHDLPRVMRLPGFVHRKGEPFVARIVEINDMPPYSAADLVPPAQEEEPPPEAPHPNGSGDGPNFDDGRDFFRKVNDRALTHADKWVQTAFPGAYKNGAGQWRVPPHALGRDCEEDLSISPSGIKDFGVHDTGDERGGKRTAIDLVIEYARLRDNAVDTALWLCEQMAVDPAALGWRGAARADGNSERQNEQEDEEDFNAPPPATEPPRPLIREFPPPEPLPVAALGNVLGNAAQAIYDRVRVPMAIGAQSVLAAAALAVQGHADIELPIGRGSRRPIGNYFITVAASGDRKSEADRQALWPVEKHEAALRARHDISHPAYINRKLAWDKAREAAARAGKGDANAIRVALEALGPAPRAPLEPMLTCPEPTFEGLCKLFAVGHPSLGIFSTEGGQFIGGHGMSEDNRLKTASGLSDLWDGKPIRRVRASDGATILPGRRLSVHLMAQPGVATILFSDEKLADQGLLSRLLISAPVSIVGTRFWHEERPETDYAIRRYGARLLDILERKLPLRAGTVNELQPHGVALSPAARVLWIKFVNHIEREIATGGELEPIRGLANKMAEHAARLGTVLALVENIDASEVTIADIEAGIALAEYYASEALRLHGAARVCPELTLAQKLLNWLLTTWREGAISLPAIYQLGPAAVRDKSSAMKLVTILEDHGWLARIHRGAVVGSQYRRDAWRIVRVETDGLP